MESDLIMHCLASGGFFKNYVTSLHSLGTFYPAHLERPGLCGHHQGLLPAKSPWTMATVALDVGMAKSFFQQPVQAEHICCSAV